MKPFLVRFNTIRININIRTLQFATRFVCKIVNYLCPRGQGRPVKIRSVFKGKFTICYRCFLNLLYCGVQNFSLSVKLDRLFCQIHKSLTLSNDLTVIKSCHTVLQHLDSLVKYYTDVILRIKTSSI